MEITWYGYSCFRLTERRMATIVTDPYDHQVVGAAPLKLKADVVTVSRDSAEHNFVQAVKSKPRVLTGPGEYEIGGVFITAVETNGKYKNKDETRNILYVFDYEGITVAHLGSILRVPSQSQVEALGTVNVVLVPVGGGKGLNAAKAAEIVSLLEPSFVVPMHYLLPSSKVKLDPLDKFLKEMGLGKVEPQPSLKIAKSSLPDQTQIIVLDNNHT